jgi:hypothetical protein
LNVYCHGVWSALVADRGWWICMGCGRRLWPTDKLYEVRSDGRSREETGRDKEEAGGAEAEAEEASAHA